MVLTTVADSQSHRLPPPPHPTMHPQTSNRPIQVRGQSIPGATPIQISTSLAGGATGKVMAAALAGGVMDVVTVIPVTVAMADTATRGIASTVHPRYTGHRPFPRIPPHHRTRAP